MGLKWGDVSLPAAMMERDGALYDAAGKGYLGGLPKADYNRRQKKVIAREEAAAAEVRAQAERQKNSADWASGMTGGYKAGGSVKARGMGKARGGKPCKVR